MPEGLASPPAQTAGDRRWEARSEVIKKNEGAIVVALANAGYRRQGRETGSRFSQTSWGPVLIPGRRGIEERVASVALTEVCASRAAVRVDYRKSPKRKEEGEVPGKI